MVALEVDLQTKMAKNEKLKLALRIANEQKRQVENIISQCLGQLLELPSMSIAIDIVNNEMIAKLEAKLKLKALQMEILTIVFISDKANLQAEVAHCQALLKDLIMAKTILSIEMTINLGTRLQIDF